MKEPKLVKDCLLAMQKYVNIPVSIKCRIGIDKDDSYEFLRNFISFLSDDGHGTIK
jgi:tRNA-dihydrouridine synthase A